MQNVTSEPGSPPGERGDARYQLREHIASGGMGLIYRAYDNLAEREVAYKRLLRPEQPALQARASALFEREYNTLARLAHPRIVEAYDYGFDEQGPYYTMELLTGEDLTKLAPLPYLDACRMLRDVASALALIHARRLIHRDVSPRNVRRTGDGHAKLIDFGALMPFGSSRELVGTVPFMAPECLEEGALDQRVDLYALGALAYWALTGRLAVPAQSIDQLARAWLEPIVPPSRFAPEIPEALDDFVIALLQRDPLARPASAAHVLERLNALADLPPEDDERKVAYSYVAHPPLVGCEEVRTELVRCMGRQGATGCGEAVLIEGSQGLGRTALLDEVALLAQVAGVTVLRAQGGRQVGALALARVLISSALRVNPELHPAFARRHPEAIAFCLPDATSSSVRPVHVNGQAAECHAELLVSLQSCVLELAQIGPLVLLVDDVERADAESLALLVSLAHEARRCDILLVTTALEDAPSRDQEALVRLARASCLLRLAPLSEAEADELVSSMFGDAPNRKRLARFLYGEAAGNPQRTMELLRLLIERDVVRYRAGLFSLPHDAAAELGASELGSVPLARFEGLSGPARQLAQLLSCEDGALPLDVLSRALELAGRRLRAPLEELATRRIVNQGVDRIAFASQPLRGAAASTLEPDAERALHVRLARAYLAREGPLEQRLKAAVHLLKGGAHEEGAELLARSAELLAYRSEGLADAVPALEQALTVYGSQGRSDSACVQVLVALVVAGFYGDARLSARYLERTMRVLLELSGTALAAKLGRFIGARLALLIGLAYGYVRVRCTPRGKRHKTFPGALSGLLAVASAGAGAAIASYEPAQAIRVAAQLAPFAALGPSSAPGLVHELCRGLADIMRAAHPELSARMLRVIARLSRPGKIRGLKEDLRLQMLHGALYLRGISEVYSGSREPLSLAAQLEASGRAFSRPRAELLRMCYCAFRGDQESADAHRTQAEVLALLGGTLWSATSAVAVRMVLVSQWTRDSVALRRAIDDLERLSTVAPALYAYRELAEAYLEFLRGHAEGALSIYERRARQPSAVRLVTWAPEAAHHAEALNALGRHDEARERCLAALGELSEADRRMRFLHQPVLQELALSEALLGDTGLATGRLEALIEEVEPLDNPLLSGALHRDRCRVALIAHEPEAFVLHLRKMTGYFRGTRNPSLIQQCDLLASEGARAGLVDLFGRRLRRPFVAANDDMPETTPMTKLALFERRPQHRS